MEVPQPIQLFEDDEDDLEEEAFDEYEEDDDIDDSVAEDMKKLEESFKGISQKYRLINRIGEGSIRPETEGSNTKN
jgi:cell division control protein 7